MAEPIIYGRNFVDGNCDFVASHSSGEIPKVHDFDKDSQWISSGANSDATQISIEIHFMEAGAAISRTIDTIILVNHNLADLSVDYWDGSTWQNIDSDSGLTDDFYKFTFNSLSTERIRVTGSATQTANQEKQIGEIMAMAVQLSLGSDLYRYRVKMRQKANEFELGDGSVHRTVVKHSPNRSHKYEASLELRYITTAVLDTLRQIKETGIPFVFQPESVSQPDELYFVHWSNPLTWEYVTTYKGAGVSLQIELKEV